jgi:hypothetical protein
VSRTTERRRGLALARWLVRRYPSVWRARYADELLAWVAERGLGALVALDLVLGALDAHLHPRTSCKTPCAGLRACRESPAWMRNPST